MYDINDIKNALNYPNTHRARLMAQVIHKYYSKDIRIADIGCGSYTPVQNELVRLGHTKVVSYDPCLNDYNSDNIVANYFIDADVHKFDLLTGVYTCMFIHHFLKWARYKNFVVFPCGCGEYYDNKHPNDPKGYTNADGTTRFLNRISITHHVILEVFYTPITKENYYIVVGFPKNPYKENKQ